MKMEVGAVDKTVGYETITDRVLYDNIDPDVKEVQMRLCLPFSQWEMTDDIPMPEGVASLIIESTIASVKGEAIEPNVFKKQRNG